MSSNWLKRFEDLNGDMKSSAMPSLKSSSIKKRTRSEVASSNGDNRESAKRTKSTSWDTKFQPRTIDDLAVNRKKIDDLRIWIETTFKRRNKRSPMLLITGPTGSGKTATLQILCRSMGIKLTEWLTGADTQFVFEGYEDYLVNQKESDKFKQFLLEANYPSLLDDDEDFKKIILIEDYPNTFLTRPEQFVDVLQFYHPRASCPLVFITTDTNDRNVNVQRVLFPQTIISQFSIDQINFNAISPTLMKKALKRAAEIQENYPELYKKLSNDALETISNSSFGDVRNAISNIHFAALKGSATMAVESHVETSKTVKKKPITKKTLKDVGTNESIDFMHAIGRVLNPKRNEMGAFASNPDIILSAMSQQPDKLIRFVHENYLDHFSDVETARDASDVLSLADEMSCLISKNVTNNMFDLEQNVMLRTVVHGVMNANKNPKTGWVSVRAPKYLKRKTPLEMLNAYNFDEKESYYTRLPDVLLHSNYYNEILHMN